MKDLNVIDTLEQILNIESVSGNEKELANFIETQLSSFEHISVTRLNNNIVAKVKGESDETLILAGHIDTVPISKITNNFPSIRTNQNGDEYISGRGSVDMKPGVAIMIELAKKLEKPRSSLTFIFYECEEVDASRNGLGHIVKSKPELIEADAAILLEPTNCEVEAGCNGTLRFDVILTGKAAHSARSFMGENAIHKAQGVFEILNAWNDKEHIVEVDTLEFREGLNAVMVNGGTATNVIPDLCKIHINYRFAPDKSTDEAIEYIHSLFSGYEIEMKDISSGARPGMENGFCKEFAEFANQKIGSTIRAKLGWTDVARFSALQIPALNFAPADPNLCHHDQEQVKVSDVEKCYQLFVDFLI